MIDGFPGVIKVGCLRTVAQPSRLRVSAASRRLNTEGDALGSVASERYSSWGGGEVASAVLTPLLLQVVPRKILRDSYEHLRGNISGWRSFFGAFPHVSE
jgi:hypothetical protein